MRSILLRAVWALFFLGCHVNVALPQSIGDISNLPRIHGPAGQRFMNDEPFSHRYQYGVSPQLYLNGDGRALWYQDYLDRVDRAEKFGYQMPVRPRYGYPPDYDRPPLFHGGSIGIGFGRFKRW